MRILILALHTTSEFRSLALVDSNRVVDEVWLHAPEGFGHVLYPRLGHCYPGTAWGPSLAAI